MIDLIQQEMKSLLGDRAVGRRSFIVSALGSDFALAALPVSAQTMITTPADGLVAGEVKVPAAGGNARSEFVIYPDTPHAFNADYRPSYRKAAADDGWKRATAWFKTNLG